MEHGNKYKILAKCCKLVEKIQEHLVETQFVIQHNLSFGDKVLIL